MMQEEKEDEGEEEAVRLWWDFVGNSYGSLPFPFCPVYLVSNLLHLKVTHTYTINDSIACPFFSS